MLRIKIILFSIGAFGYGLMELLWRGYTHPSMLTAGGICFTFFGFLSEKMKKKSIYFKALIGGAFITGIELIFGIVFNIILRKNVWNYSRLPLNLGGQICVLYSAFWTVLSFAFIPLAGKVSRTLKN